MPWIDGAVLLTTADSISTARIPVSWTRYGANISPGLKMEDARYEEKAKEMPSPKVYYSPSKAR